MAKGKSLLKIRGKKKIKVSKVAQKLADEKFYGSELPPVSDRGRFLSYCNAMIELSEARAWMDEYLVKSGRSLRGVPDSAINTSACHRAKLKLLGAPFTPAQDELLEKHVSEMLVRKSDTAEAPSKPRASIQDNIREKFSDIMGELEGMIDDGLESTFDFEKWCREQQVSPRIGSMIKAKIGAVLNEYFVVQSVREMLPDQLNDEGKQILEGYDSVPNHELDSLIATYSWMFETLERMIENEKRARAPRKPKPVSVEKKLKHLNETYQKFSKEHNVNSIDPSKILGAKELWTLNTKYKLITVYRADSMGGELDVARCKVVGFNRNDSHTYRLGRGQKQVRIVDELIKSSRAQAKKLVSDLKDAPLQERIGENTVLLRVM